jgi:translocation and assembly module TamB
VQIAVTGSASAPELELRSDPRLEQADILAVLLFGRPTSALSEGEKSSLSDQAAGIATSFAVAEVSREVTRALGIEELGVQIEEISTERVAVGAYVAENTFVTVAQDVGGEGGREVSIEYEFVPPSWSIVTSTSSTGESGGDVIWKKRY